MKDQTEPEDENSSPETTVAHWLTHIYSGRATRADRAAFAQWLASDPRYARAYAQLQQIWRDIAFADEGALDPDQATDELEAKEPQVVGNLLPFKLPHETPASVRWYRAVAKVASAIAASVALLIMTVHILRLGPSLGEDRTSENVASIGTGIGEIRMVTLSDGSTITLSGASSIRVEFDKALRRTVLVRGDAFFDVAHDPQRPFVVDAKEIRVKAIGTQFAVDRGASRVRIAVGDGVVLVSAPRNARAPGQRSNLRLIAGQRVAAAKNGALGEVERIDKERIAQWRTGQLLYRNIKLADVLEEVNRYRSKPIILAAESLNAIPITIAMRTNRTDALLTGLEATGTVTVERRNGEIVLHAK